jgi:hypothetical protein
MLWGWLRSVASRVSEPPPLPSDYIAQFLDGEITVSEFASNICDGWIGSDSKDWGWQHQLYDIEKRYNPDFPGGSWDAWCKEEALADLRQLMVELRTAGR